MQNFTARQLLAKKKGQQHLSIIIYSMLHYKLVDVSLSSFPIISLSSDKNAETKTAPGAFPNFSTLVPLELWSIVSVAIDAFSNKNVAVWM